MELKIYQYPTIDQMYESGKFNEDQIEAYYLFLKGISKVEVARRFGKSVDVIQSFTGKIYAEFNYKQRTFRELTTRIFYLNSALELAKKLEINIAFLNTLENFDLVINLTPAQKITLKLLLNGYSNFGISQIAGTSIKTIHVRLNIIRETINGIISKNEKVILKELDFGFDSLLYLKLLYAYAVGILDSEDFEERCDNNLRRLMSTNNGNNKYKPIIKNVFIKKKLEQLRVDKLTK